MRRRLVVPVALFSLTIVLAAQTSVIQPKDLDARLRVPGAKPAIVYVGFGAPYRAGHIPGAVFAGAASQPEGLEALKAAVNRLPRDREIVVYCGCCPWDACPNIRPALTLLRDMGFTQVKALMIPANFAADWVEHGFAIESTPAK
jgi:hypothetical protein